MTVKAYTKEECGRTFNRVEIDVCRRGFRDLGISNLDDLCLQHPRVVEAIFNSFCLLKIDRKKVTDQFSGLDLERWFNGHKRLPVKLKAERLSEKFPENIRSINEFRRRFMLQHSRSEECRDKLIQYLVDVFFADIDEAHFESILRDHTSKAWQKKLELKAKRLLAKDVREAISKALKKKKVEYLFSVCEQVLEKIRYFLDGKGDYRYLGNLNGLLKSLKAALNKVDPEFDEMKILGRFREWGKDTWRARDSYDDDIKIPILMPFNDDDDDL